MTLRGYVGIAEAHVRGETRGWKDRVAAVEGSQRGENPREIGPVVLSVAQADEYTESL